jgi:hypothetical protein
VLCLISIHHRASRQAVVDFHPLTWSDTLPNSTCDLLLHPGRDQPCTSPFAHTRVLFIHSSSLSGAWFPIDIAARCWYTLHRNCIDLVGASQGQYSPTSLPSLLPTTSPVPATNNFVVSVAALCIADRATSDISGPPLLHFISNALSPRGAIL